MTDIAELQGRIERTTEKLRVSYDETMKAVKELKEKMRMMELAICRGETDEARQVIIGLNSASTNLNNLTSSLISTNMRAWEQYRGYEVDCEKRGLKSSKLAELRTQCEKTEELATDLLCYSLGHLDPKS